MVRDHIYRSLVSHLKICNLVTAKSFKSFQQESGLVKSLCYKVDLSDKVENDSKKHVD